MAAEEVRVKSPVEIKSDSEASVAFEMAKFIGSYEDAGDAARKTRDYWLTLYVQCRKATAQAALRHVLERS